MTRRGWKLGREQTRRLIRKSGLRGVQRGKPVFTTITDPAAARPADLVNRQFKAPAPNRLWVADITFVRTWQGFCYTAFVTDACTKKIVGWAVSATMRTEDLPLQAFNHAVWQTNSTYPSWSMIPTADPSTYRWPIPTGSPSSGSPHRSARDGDSYDNALAEAINAAYKTELINRGKPWRCIDDVELSTAEWVAWYNQERLHEALGYIPTSRVRGHLEGGLRHREPANPGPRNRIRNKTWGSYSHRNHLNHPIQPPLLALYHPSHHPHNRPLIPPNPLYPIPLHIHLNIIPSQNLHGTFAQGARMVVAQQVPQPPAG